MAFDPSFFPSRRNLTTTVNAQRRRGKDKWKLGVNGLTVTKSIEVRTLYVLPGSARPYRLDKGSDFAGLILYQNEDGDDIWFENSRFKKSGKQKVYPGAIILQRSKDVKDVQCKVGRVHGKVFKYMFGRAPPDKMVRSGFARVDGVLKFNSVSCNANVGTGYNTGHKTMNQLEQEAVTEALENWIDNGDRRTRCKYYINPL